MTQLYGFNLDKKQYIKEVNSYGYCYTHQKTGLKLFYLQNDDTNKSFNISFATPPANSTGVAHITEHSVLCGSTKYPVKEPFVDLIKGSLNTFLNAMTYPDSTYYPFASQNEQDFMNIMGIYLDAVFCPNSVKREEIFLQEGWHYHLENKQDDLTINGVVYNEMKGSFSSPETLIFEEVQKALFNNAYANCSGGNPDFIPELSYKEFVEFHQKYYHPSNASIFLYGDCDINKVLAFIDKEYLSKFDRLDVDSKIIPTPVPNKFKTVNIAYPIGEQDTLEDKTFVNISYVVEQNPEINFAMSVLAQILFGTEASPVKLALLNNNLCGDVSADFVDSLLQPVFTIQVSNTNPDKVEQIKQTIFDTLYNLYKNGIDKELVEACLNKAEFDLREANHGGLPKGVIYSIACLFSNLYGLDAFAPLYYEDVIAKLRAEISNNYFENLLEEKLLNNVFGAMVVLTPQKGIGEQKAIDDAKKLAEYKASLSSQEIDQIVAKTQALQAYQQAPDTKEATNTIPVLSLSDLDKKSKFLPVETNCQNNVTIVSHQTFTNGIAYVNLMFDTSSVAQQDLAYLGILSKVLSKLNTANHTYEQISKQSLIHSGGIEFSTNAYSNNANTKTFHPYLIAEFKAVDAKIQQTIELVKDILLNTDFTDKARLLQILNGEVAYSQMFMLQAGHSVVSYRVGSYFSPIMNYFEKTTMYTYFDLVKSIVADYDNKADELVAKLISLAKQIITKPNLFVGVTGAKEQIEALNKAIDQLTTALPASQITAQPQQFTVDCANEAFLTPSNVQYVGQGYNFIDLGFKYSGQLLVASTILRSDYLWNNVRVLGGAYGAMLNMGRNGNFVLVSYRDPKLAETYQVYENMPKYLQEINLTDKEILKYIIGTFQRIDAPLTPQQAGQTAITYYINKLTADDIQQTRNEIFACTNKDLVAVADLVKAVLSKHAVATLGNAQKIQENKDLFKKLI
ncbi:MAG: insulinase family protein [Clostridia bacterium]